MTRYTDPTFIHPNGKDTSIIDFFLYKQRTEENIISINRLEKYMENVSDHYPISLTMKLKLEKTIIKTTSKSANNRVTRINWNKVDKQQYACSAANKLLNTDSVINSMDLKKIVYTINKLLTDSAKECYPDRKKGIKKPKLKVINPDIQNAIQEKKKAFYLWKQNGRSNNPSNFFLL